MIEYKKDNILKNIKLEIPAELITGNAYKINYELLKGKIIIGLCGYAGSGKDEFGKPLVERLNFKRLAFAETIKEILDNSMRQQTYEDLQRRGINLPIEDICQLNPKTREIKEIIRPYVIWLGETMKKLNGNHYWTNKLLESMGNNKKIVITDVRRPNELEIFEQNKEYLKKRYENRRNVGVPQSPIDLEVSERGYESLLLNINQRDLIDEDPLTLETIKIAHEKWLFDEIVYIDSKIPKSNERFGFREKHILNHIHELIKKHPDYFV